MKLDNQKGFTLVELAVVMIIIGLLIGGILKGQELIANAQVASTVTQMKGIDAATSTFRDSYAALPGDMSTAQARLPNCTAAPCTNGDGNGRITETPDAVPAAGQENTIVWAHLSVADLIGGISNSGTLMFGESLPAASVGGGYFFGYDNSGSPGTSPATTARGGHYLALTGVADQAVGSGGSTNLTGSQAARIDRKLDDGVPDTGSVISDGGGCDNGGAYDENAAGSLCALYFRIQQ
jgi:prepilin-type N-terminal cleavage/methylation domain-containing protein